MERRSDRKNAFVRRVTKFLINVLYVLVLNKHSY